MLPLRAGEGRLLQIAEADYGCEERPEDAAELVFLRWETAEGEICREVPERVLTALGLEEGKTFSLSALDAALDGMDGR